MKTLQIPKPFLFLTVAAVMESNIRGYQSKHVYNHSQHDDIEETASLWQPAERNNGTNILVLKTFSLVQIFGSRNLSIIKHRQMGLSTCQLTNRVHKLDQLCST
jgi:hypothetical protein